MPFVIRKSKVDRFVSVRLMQALAQFDEWKNVPLPEAMTRSSQPGQDNGFIISIPSDI